MLPSSDLQRRIEACRICIERPLKEPLPHDPRPVVRLSSTARICIAGQAPGLRVHESGLPFDDASGNRLRDWLGVDRETFYAPDRLAIVPMGFCFPGYDAKGSDLPPRRECRAAWHDEAFEQMPQIELVIAIGAYAQRYHLRGQQQKTVTATVEDWRKHLFVNSGVAVLPTPHPSWRNTAWLKRNAWFERDVLPVLKERVASLI